MMMIDELKVGQEYRDTSDDSRFFTIIIKYIGKNAAFYEAYTDGAFDHESEASIDSILKHYTPAPKPKKKIKLIGWMISGEFREFEESNINGRAMNAVKVSERFIEIEDN